MRGPWLRRAATAVVLATAAFAFEARPAERAEQTLSKIRSAYTSSGSVTCTFVQTYAPAGLERNDRTLTLTADTDFALKAVNDILQTKLVKRGVSLKALDYGKVEPAAKGTVRQVVTIQQGIPSEKAKEIVKAVKDSKIKVQVAIQGEQLRVSGKKKDDLQAVIALLRGLDFGLPLQFTNFRA